MVSGNFASSQKKSLQNAQQNTQLRQGASHINSGFQTFVTRQHKHRLKLQVHKEHATLQTRNETYCYDKKSLTRLS